MAKSLNAIIAALPRKRREKIAARGKTLIAQELTLRALRQALGQTQAKLAADLGVGQDTVSRMSNALTCCSPRFSFTSKQWAAN